MKKKRKPGRPSKKELSKTGPKTNWKMTPETIGKLEAAFAIDCSIVEACAFADINTDTYYQWIKINPELSDRFQRLQKRPILRAKDTVFKGLIGNPELALKYLKSRLPKEFNGDLGTIDARSVHFHVTKVVDDIEKITEAVRTDIKQDVADDASLQD